MIKAVTFDLDDTLWAVDPVINHANRTLWEWLHANTPAVTAKFAISDLNEGSALRARLIEKHPEIAYSMTLVRVGLLKACLVDVGYSVAEAELHANHAFAAFIEARHEVELFAHARTMLEALRSKGLIIGALSNGNAEVKRTGLADLFDFQFNADDVGQAKPHPLMFEKALQLHQLNPEEVVHVGDHPINDVKAAADLKMKTVWVNIWKTQWPSDVKPADAEVTSLDQLPSVVDSFSHQ